MKKIIVYSLVLLSFIYAGCKSEGIREGELVYQIKYLQSEDENPLIALLPKTISVKFKDNNTVAQIDGFFGTFNLKIITNRDLQKNYTVLRILDKKYINETSIDSVSAAYENNNIFKVIEKPQDTATFAGLVSYQVEIVYNKLADSMLQFYCTKDLDIQNPNANSPYFKINGVLTKFQTRVAGIDMIFELKEFKKNKINAEEFEPPKGYKQISGDSLKSILKSFQQ